jgi:hypothetical protein
MQNLSFAGLRQVLLDLEFQDRSVPGSFIRFEHPQIDTWVLLRPYQDDEVVTPATLVAVRRLLDERELMPRERFDDLMRERSPRG